jgi:inositol-hexakisphosphate 5-kinase
MGGNQDDRKELSRSPLASPIHFSTSPLDGDDDIINLLDAEEAAERIRYRSWREGNPDLKRSPLQASGRSKSRDFHKMSRKIQATLPKSEGQKISSRSRKTSQYLGLFKERGEFEDQQQQRSRYKHKSTQMDDGDFQSSEDPTKKKNELSSRQKQYISPIIEPKLESESEAHGVFQALAHGGPQYRHASTSTISSSRSQPDLQALVARGSKIDLSPRSPRPKTRDGQPSIPLLSNFQLPPPAEGLEMPLRQKYFGMQMQQKESDITPTEGAHDTDGDDSDREHISSAMYYPHRQVRPDMSPELEGAVRPTISRAQSATVTNDQHEEPVTDENIIIHSSGGPGEVEISLESADDKQLWKGDYPIVSESPEGAVELTSSYDEDYEGESSMSDFESHDESTASTVGYESEDDQILEAPNITPLPRQSRPLRKHHSRDPLGAVELKPFNHQVGGHSTVYQFSRRAVCKKLNNRENVFYETVEKYHPELLEFMPR